MQNNIEKRILKNGVKLYFYKDKSMKRVLFSYGVFYGSNGIYNKFYLDDKLCEVLPGCAHFLEHLLLEHSKFGNLYEKFSSRKYVKNGGTSMDLTNYFFIGVENIKESILELITALQDPVFSEEDVVKTSEAIVSETRRVKDNVRRTAGSIVDRNLYSNFEIVNETLSIIGDEESTKNINYNMLVNCYNAFYSDDNKAILVAGNIDIDEMTSYIESIFDKLPKRVNRRKIYNYDIEGVRTKEQSMVSSVSDDFVLIGFRNGINNNFTNKEIMYYLSFILYSKFIDDCDFCEDLRNCDIISSKIDRRIYIFSYGVHFYLSAFTKDSLRFLELIKEKLSINDFDKDYFEFYKRNAIAGQAYRIDYKYDMLQNFFYRLNYTEDFTDIDFIKSMTFDRCIELYESLNFENYSSAVMVKK